MHQKEDFAKMFKKNQKVNKSHEFDQHGYSEKLKNTRRIEKLERQMISLVQEVNFLKSSLKTQN